MTAFSALLAVVAIVAASAGILSPFLMYWVSREGSQNRAPPWSSSTGSSGRHAPDCMVAFTGMRRQALGSLAGGSLFASTIVAGAPFLLTSSVLAAAAVACWRLPRRLDHARATSPGPKTTRLVTQSKTLERDHLRLKHSLHF